MDWFDFLKITFLPHRFFESVHTVDDIDAVRRVAAPVKRSLAIAALVGTHNSNDPVPIPLRSVDVAPVPLEDEPL